jgi:hypothetical protein
MRASLTGIDQNRTYSQVHRATHLIKFVCKKKLVRRSSTKRGVPFVLDDEFVSNTKGTPRFVLERRTKKTLQTK